MVPSALLAVVATSARSRRAVGARISSHRGRDSNPSELQDLVDPFAKLRDARVNAGLIGHGATDAPANDPGENPPLIPRSLDDHRAAAVALKSKVGAAQIVTFAILHVVVISNPLHSKKLFCNHNENYPDN